MKTTMHAVLSVVAFVVCAVVYLVAAAYYDDLKDEYLIYNHTWNFTLIDVIVWKIVPVAATSLFILFLIRLIKPKRA